MRSLPLVCLALLVAGAEVRAGVIKGEVKKVDAAKGILTITIKGKDWHLAVPEDASITIQVAAEVIAPKDRLKNKWFATAEKEAGKGLYPVEITLEKKGDEEIVKKVHLFTPKRSQ